MKRTKKRINHAGVVGERSAPLSEKKAMRIYNKIFTLVKKEVGNKLTYGRDLDKVARVFLGSAFVGVFPSDKIPRLNSLRKYAILNLDKSNEGGSHWIAIARTEGRNGKTYVYDSFGRGHTKIIPSLALSGNGRVINSDLDAEQKMHETNCGARSLAWLIVFDRYGVGVAKLI